jgi:hypothetical protein
MEMQTESYENFSTFGKSLSEEARKVYEEMLGRPPA